MLLAAAVFGGLSVAGALASTDFLEMDGCVHYLYARFAFREHHYLVNVWGRPVCTLIYAVGASIWGLFGARVMSMLMALGIGWISYRIACGQGYRWPVLGMIFVLAQPLVFLHSFSELTELPFALVLAGAFWAYQKRRWSILAILIGLMPAARPEGLGFVVLGAIGLVLHRQFRSVALIALPPLVWSIAGWAICGRPAPWYTKIVTWLPDNWPYSAVSVYPSGPIWHFAVSLPAIVGPFSFPAVLAGLWQSMVVGWRGRVSVRGLWDWWVGGIFGADHRIRCQWLIAVIPLMILVGHSVLFWLGRMSSSGELRYMMVVAPLWGLLAAKGWEWAFIRCRWRRPVGWSGVAALLPIVANVIYPASPPKMDQQSKRAQAVVRWYKSGELQERYPRLAVAHPGIYFFADISLNDPRRSAEWRPQTVMAAPAGTLLIWDDVYSMFNADSTRKIEVKEIIEAGWVLVRVLKEETAPVKDSVINRMAQKVHNDQVGRWYIFLSPRDAQGRLTERPANPLIE